MRILLITQDEPFYLAENIEFLIKNLPAGVSIVGCVVTAVSPFGKRESFSRKALKTLRTFGLEFFLRYSLRFLARKSFGKGSIFRVLKRLNVRVITLDKSINHSSSRDTIAACNPDLLISILGNEIFKQKLIRLAPKGCLNLHTALLPKYRGLMPTFWVLKNGEKETGVSVFFVDEGIDSGPIVVQKKVAIGNRSQEQLIRVTKRLGMVAIVEAIAMIKDGNLALIPNDSANMSYYSFPSRQDVREFIAKGNSFF